MTKVDTVILGLLWPVAYPGWWKLILANYADVSVWKNNFTDSVAFLYCFMLFYICFFWPQWPIVRKCCIAPGKKDGMITV